MTRVLISILILMFSERCLSQIDTIEWNPSSITKRQKEFFDKCEAQYFDTLGVRSSAKNWMSTWVDGRYYTFVVIDSSKMQMAFKWRKSTDHEIRRRKDEVGNYVNSEAIGRVLPDLHFVDLDGKSYSNDDLKNRIIYANFWFVGCNGCEIERDRLNQLYEQYKERVLFLSYSISKEKKTLKYLENIDFRLPTIVLEKEDRLQFSYINSFPTNMIIVNGEVKTALNGLVEGTFLVLEEELLKHLESE